MKSRCILFLLRHVSRVWRVSRAELLRNYLCNNPVRFELLKGYRFRPSTSSGRTEEMITKQARIRFYGGTSETIVKNSGQLNSTHK